MKSFILIFLFSLASSTLFAQDYSTLEKYPLKSLEDHKNAEEKIKECANYLFTTPISKDNVNRLYSIQFILRWMEGTNYTFTVDTKMTDLTDGNTDLFGMYLAGMAKVVLESETKVSDEAIHEKVTDMLIVYCKDESNNCKPTKKMKKLMKG